MHTDARELQNGTLIEADLCIVGAGAAGISMALEWKDRPERVVLLEGGGFAPELELQELYRGDSIGEPYQVPLSAARLHYFGGTTGHWAGWCARLDPIDFEERDWVPHSGWPFDRNHLDPFYARAHPYLELGPYEYDVAHYEAQAPDRSRLPLDPDVIWTKMWQFSPPTRFGTRYRDEVSNAENIHLYTYANVTDIEANEAVNAVERLRVQTLEGQTHYVRARQYVLACGSIQNARLLLASNRQAPAGLGNDHDLVGRFFMEHFEMGGAQLVLDAPDMMSLYSSRFGGERLPSGELALTADILREHRILNGTASLRPGTYGEELINFFQNFSNRTQPWEEESDDEDEPDDEEELNRRLRSSVPDPSTEGYRAFRLQSRAEQAPNPASRVVLDTERDALGMPRANLDWQLTELDKRSMRAFYEILGREMGRLDLGRLQLLDWLFEDDDVWPSFLGGGFHHMGTTRMHEDPQQGVLDANGQVHGIDNLHVAGASMFPTAGAANPTLTLVALALRLSDHLKTRIG